MTRPTTRVTDELRNADPTLPAGRSRQDREEPDWTAEERRAITVLLSRGLITSSRPVTRTGPGILPRRRRAG